LPTIEQIREKLQEEPDDVFLNYSLAMLQKKEGLDQEALASFERCIELDPDYIAAYFHKGMYLASLGEVEQARTELETGIERARSCGDEHALGEMTEFLSAL
jgi:tetratricopeptide (TPR) repeat protein